MLEKSDNSGSSIIQVLVMMGVVAAATAGMANIFNEMAKQNSKKIAANNLADLVNELKVVLADPDNCSTAFSPSTYNPNPGSSDPQPITSITYGNRTYQVGASFGGLTIAGMSWIAPFNTLNGGIYTANLQIQVKPNPPTNALMWSRQILISLVLDSNNNITKCYETEETSKNCVLAGGSNMSGSCMLPLIAESDPAADDTSMTHSTACSSPGKLFYNSSNNKLLICSGSDYVWDVAWNQPWGGSSSSSATPPQPTPTSSLPTPTPTPTSTPVPPTPTPTPPSATAAVACAAPFTDMNGNSMCCPTGKGPYLQTINYTQLAYQANGTLFYYYQGINNTLITSGSIYLNVTYATFLNQWNMPNNFFISVGYGIEPPSHYVPWNSFPITFCRWDYWTRNYSGMINLDYSGGSRTDYNGELVSRFLPVGYPAQPAAGPPALDGTCPGRTYTPMLGFGNTTKCCPSAASFCSQGAATAVTDLGLGYCVCPTPFYSSNTICSSFISALSTYEAPGGPNDNTGVIEECGY